ncbi:MULTISPECIES: helix-turn-helix domain-containing protein [unclassified Halorhabdus]|uniref:ArsR/SmtB family transcription factor n=1 Tax=unclassified Halorhabdus TaxID=2621901 RepID=UPI0023DA256B|nr:MULTISPECIES: helix-turn-helix domain-containing protein [unclassified Halorhabdus]WEL18603.1 Transcriptional regulator containing HTH domain,ArsR family [Halorhabdus sp. SVX81]WEL22712.1 Transcriptional regulator containing HTH domain,ArsR family [Halorhabdus sp. BNX81]
MIEHTEDSLYEQQADLCTVFSNAKRLKLLDLLKDDSERTVTELQEATGIPQSTVSRHLKLMRDQGVVTKRNDGVHSYYTLSDERVATSMELMRDVLIDRLEHDDQLAVPE